MAKRLALLAAAALAALAAAGAAFMSVPARDEPARGDAFLLRGFDLAWKLTSHPVSFIDVTASHRTGKVGFGIRGGSWPLGDRAAGEVRVTGIPGAQSVYGGAWRVDGGQRVVSWDLTRFGFYGADVAVGIASFDLDTRAAHVDDGVHPQAIEARIEGVWRHGPELRCRLSGVVQAGIADRGGPPPVTEFWPTLGLVLFPVPPGGEIVPAALERRYESTRPLEPAALAVDTGPRPGGAVPLITGFSWRIEEAGGGCTVRALSLDVDLRRDPAGGPTTAVVSEALSNAGPAGLGGRPRRVKSRIDFSVVVVPDAVPSRGARAGRADIP